MYVAFYLARARVLCFSLAHVSNSRSSPRLVCTLAPQVYVAFYLANNHGRALIFVNQISGAKRLASLLTALGFPHIRTLHAKMQQVSLSPLPLQHVPPSS